MYICVQRPDPDRMSGRTGGRLPCLHRQDSPGAGGSNAHYFSYCKLYCMSRTARGIIDEPCVMSRLRQTLAAKTDPATARLFGDLPVTTCAARGPNGRSRQPRMRWKWLAALTYFPSDFVGWVSTTHRDCLGGAIGAFAPKVAGPLLLRSSPERTLNYCAMSMCTETCAVR